MPVSIAIPAVFIVALFLGALLTAAVGAFRRGGNGYGGDHLARNPSMPHKAEAWESRYQGADEPPMGAGWQPFAVHTEPRDRDSGQVYVFVHWRRRIP